MNDIMVDTLELETEVHPDYEEAPAPLVPAASRYYLVKAIAYFYVSISLVAFFMLGLLSKRYGVLKNKYFLSALFMLQQGILFVFFRKHVYIIGVNFVSFLPFYLGVKMIVIGLTGGIATGKSSVSNILKSEGFHIVDADQISHDLLKNDKGCQEALVGIFGNGIWNESKKEIDREKMGQIIFADPKKRK